jgi:multimeric flavodoxin WrbA
MVSVQQSYYDFTENEREIARGFWRSPDRILAIQAAPRGRRGVTELVSSSFLDGMERIGSSIDKVYLADLNVQICQGCFKCWKGPESKCPIEDDLGPLLNSIPAYDLMVLATPLYVDGVPGLLKTVIDRAMILNHPAVTVHDGVYLHPSLHKRMPNMVLVAVCALPGNQNFRLLEDYMLSVGRHMHMPLVAQVLRPETMSFMHPSIRHSLSDLKEYLVQAGEQVSREGSLSEELAGQISRPILTEKEYLALSLSWWR